MLISKSSVKLCEVSDTILHDTLPILKYAGSISKKVQMLTGTNDFIYMIHISGNCEIRPQICVNLRKVSQILVMILDYLIPFIASLFLLEMPLFP